MLIRITVDNRGPDAATLHCCRRSGSATPGRRRRAAEPRPALRQIGGRPRRSPRRTRCSAMRFSACDGDADAALHRERDQHRAAVRDAEPHAVRQGRLQRLRRPRPPRRGESRRGPARRRRRTTRSTVPAGESAGRSGCGCPTCAVGRRTTFGGVRRRGRRAPARGRRVLRGVIPASLDADAGAT